MEKYGNPDYTARRAQTCEEADQIEEALAHIAAAKMILGPVAMRLRAQLKKPKADTKKAA